MSLGVLQHSYYTNIQAYQIRGFVSVH